MDAGLTRDTVVVQVEVFFRYRGQPLHRGAEMMAAGATLGALRERMGLTQPHVAVLVNGRYAPPDAVLADGDLVSFVHRTEGGSAAGSTV